MNFDKLRDEIVESQKARTDLIKWKLVLVAAIGAASVQSTSGRSSPLLFSLIPFVCLYVDAVCFHNDIRIMAIARFLRTQPADVAPEMVAYEKYCNENRPSYSLESVALQGATLILSSLVLLLGLNVHDPVIADWFQGTDQAISRVGNFLVIAGASGLVFGWGFYYLYKDKMSTIDGQGGRKLANWARKLLRRG